MRAYTSTYLFYEALPIYYVYNAFSLIFITLTNRNIFRQIYDFLGLKVYSIPYFLESSKYRTPTGYNNRVFQYGYRTYLGFWEYLKKKLERIIIFNSGIRSLTTIGGVTKSIKSYYFDEELGKYDLGDDDIAIINISGKRGQVLKAIK